MKEIDAFVADCLQKAFASDQGGVLGITGLEDYLFVPEELTASDNDIQGNPLFGQPSGNTIEEGIIPTSEIVDSPFTKPMESEPIGNVVIHTPSMSAEPSENGDFGGHKRNNKKRKKKGKGTNPGRSGFSPSIDNQEGEYLENVPVEYRVIAENKGGNLVHTLIIHSDYDVSNGEIEILVGGEDNDEEVDIVSSSNGNVHDNVISGIILKKDERNLIDIQFSDKMKHIVKLTVYEFK